MKCKYCGGNITLETAFCPYCGKPNEHAQQHAKNMKLYRRVYEKTRKGVQETTHRYTGIIVRIVIIAILVVIITALMVLTDRSYSIKRIWMRNKMERNSAQVMKQMDQYLEAEEFFAFASFCSENYIDTYDSVFESYAPAERASQSYSYVYLDIMKIACPPEYGNRDSMIENLAENLDYFYEALDMSRYEYYKNIDVEKSEKILNAMEEKVKLLLSTYCGLTEEETDSIRTMSKARRAVTLEEAISGE